MFNEKRRKNKKRNSILRNGEWFEKNCQQIVDMPGQPANPKDSHHCHCHDHGFLLVPQNPGVAIFIRVAWSLVGP